MDMPDMKPVDTPTGRPMKLVIACVAAFLIAAFAFAFFINIPEWR